MLIIARNVVGPLIILNVRTVKRKRGRKKVVSEERKEEIKKMQGDADSFDVILKKELSKEKINEIKIELGWVYENILEVLKKFSDMREEYYPVVALWIIGTYIHDEFETFPYLFFNAMRGSGKTRILRLIAELSHNGELMGSMSESVMFRTAQGSTMCIDEFEQVDAKEKQALRELLNSAYKKGQKIKRMKKQKEEYVVEEFFVYSSICLANIWGMEEVLGDRCLTLVLEKSNKPYITKLIENYTNDEQIQEIKVRISKIQCSLCNVVMKKEQERGWNDYIKDKYSTTLYTYTTYNTDTSYITPETLDFYNKLDDAGIEGRHFELTFPLLVISQFLSNFDSILEIIKQLIVEKKEDSLSDSKDVQVFDFVGRKDSLDFISVTKLTQEFREFIGVDPQEHTWVNSRWFGRALKRLVLVKEKVRRSGGNQVILNSEKAREKMRMFQ